MLDINCIKSSFFGLIVGFLVFMFSFDFLLSNIAVLLKFSLHFLSSGLNFLLSVFTIKLTLKNGTTISLLQSKKRNLPSAG